MEILFTAKTNLHPHDVSFLKQLFLFLELLIACVIPCMFIIIIILILITFECGTILEILSWWFFFPSMVLITICNYVFT